MFDNDELLKIYAETVAESQSTINYLTSEEFRKMELNPDWATKRVDAHKAIIAKLEPLIEHVKAGGAVGVGGG